MSKNYYGDEMRRLILGNSPIFGLKKYFFQITNNGNKISPLNRTLITPLLLYGIPEKLRSMNKYYENDWTHMTKQY